MNAFQVTVREEIFSCALSRGFHFDKVVITEDGDYLVAHSWVGRQSSVLRILFIELLAGYRNRYRFCDEVCDRFISRDQVMTKDEIIYRRNEAIGMQQITIPKGFYDQPRMVWR